MTAGTMEHWMRAEWDRLQREWPVKLPFQFTELDIAALSGYRLDEVRGEMVRRLEVESKA